MKQTIITILLAIVALAVQAKTFKTIKNPVAMACVNVSNGELKPAKLSSETQQPQYISQWSTPRDKVSNLSHHPISWTRTATATRCALPRD